MRLFNLPDAILCIPLFHFKTAYPMIRPLLLSRLLLLSLVFVCTHAALVAQSAYVRSLALNPFHADVQPIPATGGYLLASRIYVGFTPTMIFMELDSFSRTQATYGYTSLEELEVMSLIPLAGGNYAGIGGGADSSGTSALTLLVDAQGQVSQVRLYNRGGHSRWGDGVGLPDSGFVAVGSDYDLFSESAIIARFDAQGDTLWYRTLTSPNSSLEFEGVTLLPDGDLMVIGSYYNDTLPGSDGFLTRFSPNGTLRWSRRIPTTSSTFASDIVLSGNKLFVSINTEDSSSGYYNIGVAAFDTAANGIWATMLRGYNDGASRTLTLTATGDPLLLGHYDTLSGYNASLAAFSSTGSLLWAKGYDLHGEAEMLNVHALSGGRYLLVAEEYTSNEPLHLIQTLADGLMPGPCNSVTPSYQPSPLTFTAVPLPVNLQGGTILVSPVIATSNPTIDNLLNCDAVAIDPGKALLPAQLVPHPMREGARLVLPVGIRPEGATLQVMDMGGRMVDMSPQMTADGFELQRNGLAAGLYAYQIFQDGVRVVAGKLVLVD